MALLIFGLSHKTAPLDVRERLAFDGEQLPGALDALNASNDINESLILSTCNRTELYVDAHTHDCQAPLDWLSGYRGVGRDVLEPHMYQLRDEMAVRHVFRVASGLDSLVVGEPQILGQLKDAYRAAVGAGTVGRLLNRLMQLSFSTAKLVRSETEIGATPVSVAFAAVKLAQQIHGELGQRTALLLGAGDTMALVASHLAGAGIGRMLITNRSPKRAHELAARYANQADTEAFALTELPSRLADADIVVSSTASRLPIITHDIAEVALRRRRGDPMFFVDLAVPRDVDRTVADLDDAYVYTVDDLEAVTAANLEVRHEAAAEAEEMVHLKVQDYLDWVQTQSSGASIAAFRKRGETMRDEALARAAARLAAGDPIDEVLQQFAHTLTNKLLHHPTAGLRAAAGREELLHAAREILGLDKPTP